MKTKATVFFSLALMIVALGACAPAGAASPEPAAATIPAATKAPAAETFSDPFAYCAAVGQIDAPDARYTGPLMSDDLFNAYLKAAGLDAAADYPENFQQMTVWRCMDSKLYVCNFGANIPCDSKANTDKTPTQEMTDYCKEFPDADFIPMYVTGHNGIYSWRCSQGAPELLDQIDTVDAAGYQSSFWQLVEPAP